MKSEKEYVLIVIPTYNRAKLLPITVKSVTKQDYPFLRIIIVDDGSTDDTKKVCLDLTQEHPQTISYCYKPNGGCASARNHGLAYIDESTKYVCFLDSDDQMIAGKLSREVILFEESPDASFCYSDYILFMNKNRKETIVKPAAAGNPERFAIEHFLTNNAKPGAVLFKAHVFADKKFDESLRYNEDSELLQRIAIERKCVYSPLPSCWVRVHVAAKSQDRVEIYRAVLSANKKVLIAYPEFYDQHREVIDRRMEQIKSDLFAELAMRGYWKEAQQYAASLRKKIILRLRLGTYYRLKLLLTRMLS